MRYTYLKLLIALSCSTLLFACAGDKAKEKAEEEKAAAEPVAEDLYNDAANLLEEKRYKPAAEAFEKVERETPYSPWAVRAQVMAAYSYYKNGKYDDAVLAVNRFLELHPGNENAPYAYYLKALSYYDQIADIRRDQKITEQAQSALKELAARYPETDYARDARLKLDLVHDHLGGKEMEIGRFYLKKGNTLAAINRFKKVVEEYQTTTHVPEALYRLVEAYVTLGILNEAQKYAAVLGYNYPSNIWYDRAYKLLEGNVPPLLMDVEDGKVKGDSLLKKTLKAVGVKE